MNSAELSASYLRGIARLAGRPRALLGELDDAATRTRRDRPYGRTHSEWSRRVKGVTVRGLTAKQRLEHRPDDPLELRRLVGATNKLAHELLALQRELRVDGWLAELHRSSFGALVGADGGRTAQTLPAVELELKLQASMAEYALIDLRSFVSTRLQVDPSMAGHALHQRLLARVQSAARASAAAKGRADPAEPQLRAEHQRLLAELQAVRQTALMRLLDDAAGKRHLPAALLKPDGRT